MFPLYKSNAQKSFPNTRWFKCESKTLGAGHSGFQQSEDKKRDKKEKKEKKKKKKMKDGGEERGLEIGVQTSG